MLKLRLSMGGTKKDHQKIDDLLFYEAFVFMPKGTCFIQ